MNVGYDDNINDGGDNFHDNNNINCWQEGPIVIRKDQYTNDRKRGLGTFLLANMKLRPEITRTVKQS